MTAQTFLSLIIPFSLITGLITEAAKKVIPEKWSINLTAMLISIVVGIVGMLIYFTMTNTPLTIQNGIYIVLMGLTNGVGAMVGYDKLMQTLDQIKKNSK